MIEISSERTILAYTLHANTVNPFIGMVKAVAEIVEDKLIPITHDGFCPTMRVFITSHYDDIEKRFPDQQLFKLVVNKNEKKSDLVESSNTCEYVATASKAEEIKTKDFFEVVNSSLPDANDRTISLNRGNPVTRYIFVNDGEYLYGPFRWKVGSDIGCVQLEFIDAPLPAVKLESYQTYQIKESDATSAIVKSYEIGATQVVSGLDIIKRATYYDYASDAEIIKYCLKLQSEAGARIIEKSKADLLVSQISKNPKNNVQFIKQRLARLPAIIDGVTEVKIDLEEAMSSVFATDTGKDILGKFVDKNEDRFLEKLKRDRRGEIEASISGLVSEQQRATQRLNEIEIQKRQQSDALQELRNSVRDEQQVSLTDKVENAVVEMSAAYQKVKNDLEDVESQLSVRKKLLDKYKTHDDIDMQITILRKLEEREKDRSKDEIKDLNESKRVLQLEVNKSAEELRTQLIKLKPFVDSINGSYFPEVIQERCVAVITHPFVVSESLVNRQRLIVQALASQLEFQGRSLQDWEIVNLLITTQQSFITVLAGLPGTGKTTLARLLAQVQGLNSRLQEVPVARGWTSQKDLIGYFNPLTSRFQSSGTGLYDYLCALSNEKDNDCAMAYTLLDEANLSPLEHYWSSFMDMADGKVDMTLRLGQQVLNIPYYLRFIATINYDGTTEPLSQRLINRAPIVLVEESELTHANSIEMDDLEPVSLPISSALMNELFGKSLIIPDFFPNEEACFHKIKKALTNPDMALGRPVSISPRKEIAIKQYCNKARAFMGEDNDLAALDMAVLQHVLPLVNGNGIRFKARLDILKDDLNEQTLLRSARYVERMIAYGSQDLHSYDFFCW